MNKLEIFKTIQLKVGDAEVDFSSYAAAGEKARAVSFEVINGNSECDVLTEGGSTSDLQDLVLYDTTLQKELYWGNFKTAHVDSAAGNAVIKFYIARTGI